ncbi:hypothetical protein LTR53_001253 [Teratosphaeriaceae sp. CCFEE 6253]|nr:hypothetical protein LTR53_001253 [Teratosphaeriaceae sp. CCFEE 6253]
MAAVATLSAQPALMGRPKTQRYSVDAGLLAAKLQALQVIEATSTPVPDLPSKRDPSKRASYIPRSAAAVFAATTAQAHDKTPHAQPIKGASTVAPGQRPLFTADGKPCLNPKQLQAALSLGMSESEAIATAATRRLSDNARQRSIDQQCAPPEHHSQPERSRSTRGYRPGDAAKRKLENKRRSMQPQHAPLPQPHPQAKLIAVQHGFHTTLEPETDPGSGVPTTHPTTDESRHPTLAPRPHLTAHDRHNWAQQSQCGDAVPHIHRRRASAKPIMEVDHAHDNEAQYARDGWKPTRPPPAPRQKSAGAIPEKLVAGAVERIRREGWARRRRSFVGFFRRGS